MALVKTGSALFVLAGTDTYSGETSIDAGTLKVGSAGAIPSGALAGNVAVAGTLDLDGNSITVNGLTGGGIVTTTLAGGVTLTVGANDQTSEFDGTIKDGSGIVSLVKTGAGTLTLGGTNPYTGQTTIDDGNVSTGYDPSFTFTLSGAGASVSEGIYNNVQALLLATATSETAGFSPNIYTVPPTTGPIFPRKLPWTTAAGNRAARRAHRVAHRCGYS